MSLMLCLICSSGNIFFTVNTDDDTTWTPYGSPFIKQKEWILQNYPKDTRYESIILTVQEGGNILTASTMQYLAELHRQTITLISSRGDSYTDLCVLISSVLEPGVVPKCATNSLLNLWNYNSTIINQLSDQDVLEAVTNALANSSELSPIDQIDTLISGVEYSKNNSSVTKATALMNIWLIKQNGTKIDNQDLKDERAMDWESVFIQQVIVNASYNLPLNLTFDGLADRSYEDGINESLDNNFTVMFGGFSLIFFYICITLGRWNMLEQRVCLALMGMVLIGMSLGSAFGFCFYIGLWFGELHSSLPFLLLGIGVDDMYVIVQGISNLSDSDKKLPIPDRIGIAMKHAGVSITVTSVTDMAAFLIGSSSSMPIMREFCLFAGMGVFFLYTFAITFFVGCLTLDERRIESRKVCNLGCMGEKSKDWKPISSIPTDPGKYFFANVLAPILSDIRAKILVIIVTLVCVGFGIYGVLNIKLDYDAIWFMDQKSYQTQYFKRFEEAFPDQGERVEVYIGDVPFWKFPEQLDEIEQVLRSSPYINTDSIQFWHTDFYKECCGENPDEYCFDLYDYDGKETCENELSFKRRLLLFLQEHQYYIPDFRFNITLVDLTEDETYDLYELGNFKILATRAKFQHSNLANTTIRIKAMHDLRDGLANIKFVEKEEPTLDNGTDLNLIHTKSSQNSSENSSQNSIENSTEKSTEKSSEESIKNSSNNSSSNEFLVSPVAYSYMYIQWEANETISHELIRNIGLTFATIAIVSLVLIMNLQVSIMVFICVVFSVINVCGYAHFMGLTIEMVTSISLILSVGLALDYAAHYGVIFACLKTGTREEKMRISLEQIGSAVLNGGFSTFLAFFLLAFSDAYAFNTFFKMFSMVVLFGLYHGLVFLPVLLSLIGPSSPDQQIKK